MALFELLVRRPDSKKARLLLKNRFSGHYMEIVVSRRQETILVYLAGR
jgi:hypothetical protein